MGFRELIVKCLVNQKMEGRKNENSGRKTKNWKLRGKVG